jgi:hypothetical protein
MSPLQSVSIDQLTTRRSVTRLSIWAERLRLPLKSFKRFPSILRAAHERVWLGPSLLETK